MRFFSCPPIEQNAFCSKGEHEKLKVIKKNQTHSYAICVVVEIAWLGAMANKQFFTIQGPHRIGENQKLSSQSTNMD